MHSFDRTLLSNLGFSDPDKRDPRHDLACQYLAQPKIAHVVAGEATDHIPRKGWSISRVIPEYHITKGRDQYRSTIGFADLLLFCDVEEVWQMESGGERVVRPCYGVLLEVKIHPVSIGDVLRQMALYREYSPEYGGWKDAWSIVVTAYDVEEADRETLESKRIRHFKLGASFDDYCLRRRTEAFKVLPKEI